ncbi:MAG: FecR domain-containing protein, partial [Patescibacteria group bacterium]
MKKTLIVLGVIIIIVIAGWLLKNNRPGEEIVLERPWIEVVSSLTSEVDSSGQNIKNLQTGDELSDGVILKTDETGEAIIHFPDGSEARLEANSTIIIERAAYNEESGSLFVRLTLSAGRIWSKVISLSTPESEWKVETANAVATVRGTAFGTEFINGDSNFIGSENTVLVKVKNTETGEEIDETETPLTENDVIELKDKDIKKIIALKTALAKKNLDDKTGENLKNWIEKQKEKDNGIKERLETLEKKGLTPEEAKEKLREEIKDKFKKKIIERREEIRKQILEEAEQKTEQNEPVINNILIERLRAKIVENLLARGQKEAALKIKTLTNEEISSLLKLVFSGNLEETLSDETKLKAVLED